MVPFACQIANVAPSGSVINAILPTLPTSNGSASIFAPRLFAFAVTSSAFATFTYPSQCGGTFLFSYIAPVVPFATFAMMYGVTSIGISSYVRPNSSP